jgi:mono/diheme cytochrome c family protein
MKRELLAIIIVLAVLIAFPASLFSYQGLRTHPDGVHVILLRASSPNNGDWQPKNITVKLGERVRLRLEATDVVHGLTIPDLGIAVDEIVPGHVKEVEFVVTKAGRFPFACTRWCSVDHWRMRGVLEVVDPAQAASPLPAQASAPLFQQMRIDIDAPHLAENAPQQAPSADRGAGLNVAVPAELQDINYLRTHAPSGDFTRLRADARYTTLTDDQLWDLVTFSWLDTVGKASLERGQKLYKRDCAACHGETGKGDGTAGRNLPGLSVMEPQLRKGPADFTNSTTMLGASDILLQGKILRGGMGTGMPEWGSLYTEQQMWDVINYIRSFVFRVHTAPD